MPFVVTLLRFALAKLVAPELCASTYSPLALDNLALRQQLAVLKRKNPRPRLTPLHRIFWLIHRRLHPRTWVDALLIVKPDTVVRWHRAGFRLYWRLRSGRWHKGGRKPISPELRKIIERLAIENHYGATRIHGELLKLGFDVSERTVSNYLKRLFPYPKNRLAQWRAFLHNETVASMDFLVVPTATFGMLYAFVILGHGRRNVIHVNVTAHPTAAWVSQQLREAFPGGEPLPHYLVHDHDAAFMSTPVRSTLKAIGIKPSPTAVGCPWQNGVCERFVGTVRNEVLDHVIVVGERHLLRLLKEYVAFYNAHRTHLALNKDSPLGRAIMHRPTPSATVVAISHLAGLHHRYVWSATQCDSHGSKRAA